MTSKEIYKAICEAPTDLPLFLQHWWLDAVCDHWQVAIALKGSAVVGVWPYALQYRLKINMLRNPALTPYLGPHVFFPPDIKESKKDQFEHEVIAQLLEIMPDPDVWHVALQPGLKQAGIFAAQDMRVEVQQTFLIDLQPAEDQIFANFKESHRRNIKAGMKQVTIAHEPDLLRELYSFQTAMFHHKGVDQHAQFGDLLQLMNACLDHNSAALWVARREGAPEAILWNIWDNHTSYYYMGARHPHSADHKAMSALLWHAMKEAKKRGNKVFDLEGSMDPGVEHFFRGFGGRRELYLVLRKNESWIWRLVELMRR